MPTEEELLQVHTNQRLLLKELMARGVTVDILIPELEITELEYKGRKELLLDRDSSICPYPGSVLSSNKYITKKLLQRAALPHPRGEQFFSDQRGDALRYASKLDYPLVLKPTNGSHGIGCITNIENKEELEDAIDSHTADFGVESPFLIEEQVPGMEYRVFITKNGDYAVLNRDPASVTGDGERSIKELAEIESYKRMNPRVNCLCPITIDHTAELFLDSQGLSLESIPEEGKKIYLRRNSNIALGGTCEDFTPITHPSVVELAFKTLECIPGLPYAGVDIMTTEISSNQEMVPHSVLEINSNPGLHMHMRPAKGDPQNVASYLADLIYPETKPCTVSYT